ncbi:MAG: 3-dehydroquinate synthase [Thaumarchaeota archaeon]|nr:3-dehydroquinate synthase [Nitrososphaerota archaeon]
MKEIILAPKKIDKHLLEYALGKGIRSLYCDPDAVPTELRKHFKVYFESDSADVKIVRGLEEVSGECALRIPVKGPDDVDRMVAAAKAGARNLIVETGDWKIIPLENLIADLAPLGARIMASAADLSEVETLLGVLERGVDGVIVEVESPRDIDLIWELVNAPSKVELVEGEVIDVEEVGLGERACIDTVSILNFGEGMLVGNTSSLLALVHNECMGSSFTSPRPFRVNAGAIHSYILMPNGSTRYLSELRSGDRVLVVSRDKARVAAIGRVKIERRPLKLIRVKAGSVEGSITVQDAETIALLQPDGTPIPVTSIKSGDKVLVHVSEYKARHFGKAVDEFIIEK